MKLGSSPSQRRPALPPARRLACALASALACALAVLPAAQAQSPSARFRGPDVTLNFVDAEIEGVTRAMGAILNEQFVVDPRVKGTMTLYSEEPLSPGAAYQHYLAALRGLGFTVVESGGLLKVVPEADAKLQAGTVTVGPSRVRGDQVITQIFKLSHENATSLVPVLRPLISPNNTINANPSNNTLVITDYADNLQRIGKIVAAMDTPGAGNVEVITLQHAVAADIAPLVQRLTDSPVTGGRGAPPGTQPPGAAPGAPGGGNETSVLIDPRSNALVVRAPNAARLAMIRATIAELDRPLPQGSGNIWVVYLRNADATRLATVLRAAFAAEAADAGAAAGGGGAPAPATPTPTTSGMTSGSPQAATPVAAIAAPSTGGFIQADPATNSLIITAAEPLYRRLRAVIDRLDSRRAQVYVETMIVEVNATKAADVGFQWQGLLGDRGDRTGLVGGTNFGTGGNNIINLSLGIAGVGGTGTNGTPALVAPAAGMNIGIVRNYAGTYTLAALARFLETNADGNILSTPNLVTLDNEEAKITIGQNVPFVTGQYATGAGGIGSAINPFQTIERQDVGITLRVRPQVGEDGTVRMQIYQEVSSIVNQNVSQGVADATAGIVTNKRSIESSVVVDDGQILVLGGLMQDQFQNNRDKVPVLGDAPVIGGLFRSENRTRTKTNLMVFLRPVVMRDAQASTGVSLDRYDVIRAQQQASQPEPRRLLPINQAPVLPQLGPEGSVPPPAEQSGTVTLPAPSAPGTPSRPAPVPPAAAPVPAPAPAPVPIPEKGD